MPMRHIKKPPKNYTPAITVTKTNKGERVAIVPDTDASTPPIRRIAWDI